MFLRYISARRGFAKPGAARLYAHRDGDFCFVDQDAAVYRDKRGTQSVKLVFEDPEPDIELFTDEAKVSQVWRNFISNALKFTERGEVRVSVSQALNGALSFSVADTGIGIAEQDQEGFQEWSQVEGKLQKAAMGSGLGLRSRASWLNCWVVTFSSAARRDWVRHLSQSFLLISMAKRK